MPNRRPFKLKREEEEAKIVPSSWPRVKQVNCWHRVVVASSEKELTASMGSSCCAAVDWEEVFGWQKSRRDNKLLELLQLVSVTMN